MIGSIRVPCGGSLFLGSMIFRAGLRTEYRPAQSRTPPPSSSSASFSRIWMRGRLPPQQRDSAHPPQPSTFHVYIILAISSKNTFMECHGARLRSSQRRSPPRMQTARTLSNEAYTAVQTAGAPCGPKLEFTTVFFPTCAGIARVGIDDWFYSEIGRAHV